MVAAEDGDGAAIDAPAHEAKTLASSNKIPSFRVMPTLISNAKGRRGVPPLAARRRGVAPDG